MDDDGYHSAFDDDNYSDYGDYYDDQEDKAVEEDQKEEDMLDNLQDSEDSSKSDYIVLKQEETQQLQSDEITKLSSVLSISKSDACCLLPHFNWRASTVQEEWCADEDKLREKFGLLKEPVVRFRSRDSITCGVCFDDYSYGSGSVFSAACGHPFCGDCWNGYISTSINDGPGCLMLTCPEPKCKAPVGPDLISILTSKEEYERYKHYLLRSYVEQSRTTKWCPAPDCDYAVKFNADGTGNYDVSCQCTNDFCWNCTEEIHRPVSCVTVNKWVMKNKDDSQNSQWIQVNTKPCPKCNKPIEKNQGCNHMTCRPPCGFHFCWYCLGDFKNHDHVCNGFSSLQEAVKANRSNESRDKRKLRRELERYIHYYERWATNLSSKQKALEEFNKVQSEHIDKLAQTQAESNCSLKFITEAWQQIIKCRQILRWTYAYGYYIPEEQSVKLQLFEHLQWQAENSLERLHHCAENDCKVFLEAEEPKQGFHDFRIKLTELTNNTAKYFEELVRGLENGLSEVETYANPPPPSPPPSPSPPDRWACELCTYVNEGYATRCEMCDDQEPEEEDML